MVGFNPLRRAAKAAPLLGLWPACVLMRLNATGINNCSIQALAGLGCTNSFNCRTRKLLDHLREGADCFGQHISKFEIVAPIPYLDVQRSNDPSISSNCRNCGSLSLEKSKVIDSFVFNVTG
ncbi:hypothetical protein H0E87_019628 [Populus deltoides]|uniref:Secreted protein n=1 Tax=Populus deltoides TaxID=3696 RepID=A0A8T2XVV2_POPDE|nr:hypothetical protein H0E87_019628 [Populus deltoides]